MFGEFEVDGVHEIVLDQLGRQFLEAEAEAVVFQLGWWFALLLAVDGRYHEVNDCGHHAEVK